LLRLFLRHPFLDCENLFTRLKYHYRGEGSNYTRKRQPVELIFFREFSKRFDALAFEKQIKKWKSKFRPGLSSWALFFEALLELK